MPRYLILRSQQGSGLSLAGIIPRPSGSVVFPNNFSTPLLKDFINAVLRDRGVVPVRDLKLENPINMRTVFNDKETILDVKATDENGRILDVDIQSRNRHITAVI